MSYEILFMLLLLAAALVSFVREAVPIEVTALALLAAMILTGLIEPGEAFVGFSNKAVIAIGALFLLSHALIKTGVLGLAAEWVGRRAGERSWLGVGLVLALVAVLSGFLNNTAVVAMFIPLLLDLCGRLKLSPSKVLIPLSYASIVGGTLTLVGTSTNLLVSSIVEDAGQPPLRMFEFTTLGLVFLAIGLTYILLFARRGLPARADSAALTGSYELGPYLTEARVAEDSPLIGRSCREAELNERRGVTVLAILRGQRRYVEEASMLPLQAGDVLIVQAAIDDLMAARREEGLELVPDVKLTDKELSEGGLVVAEGVVAPGSRMIGRTPEEFDFRGQFGGFVLAVRRRAGTLREKIARTRFRFSDSLLMLVPESRLAELRRSEDLVVFAKLDVEFRRARFWWVVLILLPLAVVLAALEVLEIAAGATIAAVVLMVLRVMTPEEGYRAINWSVVVLIAAFVPVGHAFIETGAAAFLADGLLGLVARVPETLAPHLLLALVYLVTSLLTQVVSNSAAAIIVAPVAISLAAELGIDARPFIIAVCFAASAEFMTPMGYQTNLMVYGPGAYRFLDYTRFGAPLNLGFWLLAALLIPRIWPF